MDFSCAAGILISLWMSYCSTLCVCVCKREIEKCVKVMNVREFVVGVNIAGISRKVFVRVSDRMT